jgi:hypothetical protein
MPNNFSEIRKKIGEIREQIRELEEGEAALVAAAAENPGNEKNISAVTDVQPKLAGLRRILAELEEQERTQGERETREKLTAQVDKFESVVKDRTTALKIKTEKFMEQLKVVLATGQEALALRDAISENAPEGFRDHAIYIPIPDSLMLTGRLLKESSVVHGYRVEVDEQIKRFEKEIAESVEVIGNIYRREIIETRVRLEIKK